MRRAFWSRSLDLPVFCGASPGGLLLTLLAVLLILAVPLWLNDDLSLHVAQQIALYTIAATGLKILVGYQGQVSLGHGGLFALGAYASALLATRLSVSVWLCFILGAALAGVVGALLAVSTARIREPGPVLVTLAFSIVTFVVAQIGTDLTGGPEGIPSIPRPEWFGVPLSSGRIFRPFGEDGPGFGGDAAYFVVLAITALLVQILSVNLLSGSWARTVVAIRDDEGAAKLIGASAIRWRVGVFGLSAVLAGLSGAFFAHQSQYIASDSFAFDRSVQLLAFAILGGACSPIGPFLGTSVLVLLPEGIKMIGAYHSLPAVVHSFTEHSLLSYGLLLVIFLLPMPVGMGGVFGVSRTLRGGRLLKDLTVLEHVMLEYQHRMRSGFFDQLLRTRRYFREEVDYRQRAMNLLTSLEIDQIAQAETRSLPESLRRRVALACDLARDASADLPNPRKESQHGG